MNKINTEMFMIFFVLEPRGKMAIKEGQRSRTFSDFLDDDSGGGGGSHDGQA